MTDPEMLKFAAKAAGIYYYARAQSGGMLTDNGEWNPLTDDGDALWLAVKLRMKVHLDANMVNVDPDGISWFSETYGNDPLAAIRRAIVRAAAVIGRNMK